MSSSARIDELRRKFDENPRRYFAPLANEYRKSGDFDQAIFICQEYLPQQPGHMSGHIVFGQALFEAKRLPEARTVFETALTLDPENLIALRHLADISRDLGEFGPAKAWYERVLQADPRNEEIAAIMASMTASAPPIGSSPIAPTAETPAIDLEKAPPPPPVVSPAAVAPTMELSAAAVQDMVKARQAALAAQAAKTEAPPELISLDDAATVEISSVATPPAPALEGFESTGSEEKFDMPSGAAGMLGFEPTSAESPVAEPTVDIHTADGSDTLTLDDFTVPTAASSADVPAAPASSDGLMDLGSFGFSEPEKKEAQPAATATPSELIPSDEVGPLDFELDIPSVPAAATPAPTLLDSVPTAVLDAIQEIEVPTLELPDQPLPLIEDLPELESSDTSPTVLIEAIRTAPKTPEPPAAISVPESKTTVPSPLADLPVVSESIDAPPSIEPLPPAAEAPPTAPFVTETMAQLYLEQGHRAEALDIYKQLVAARPNDVALRARAESVELSTLTRPSEAKPMGADTPTLVTEPAAQTVESSVSRFSSSGPTIREVLRELLGVDSQSTNGDASPNGQPGAEVGSIDTLFSAEALADAPSPLAVAFDGGYVASSGSIDAVFAGGA